MICTADASWVSLRLARALASFWKDSTNSGVASLSGGRSCFMATGTWLSENNRYAVSPISAQCCALYRNQSFVLACKSNDLFLYETQYWSEMG